MTLAIQALLGMLEELLPLITSSANTAMIGSIITALTQALPFIIQEVESLAGPVKNIIAALSATPATNAAQLATLQTLDKQVDDAFDAIAAETDAAASTTPTG
jgi:hypothetical protein